MKHPGKIFFYILLKHPIRNYVIKRSMNGFLDFKRILIIYIFCINIGIVKHTKKFYRFFVRSIFHIKIKKDMRQLNREDLDY